MRRGYRLFLFIYILLLLIGDGNYAESAQQRREQDYFNDYPSSWTEIAPFGKTVISANSNNGKIKVQISISRMRRDSENKQHKKACECDNFAIGIVVNGNEIVVPITVYCEMNDLNRGKVFVGAGDFVLMLDGGDASTSYYIKIDFDHARVLRKSVYASTALSRKTLLSETVYYAVRL